MRIPLDYYRILGLPIQATTDQLRQAYRDRTLQLPRREYSEAAIAARKQLLDEAYAVLSNTEQRQAYDAKFLTPSYDLAEDEGGAPGEDEAAAIAPSDVVDPYTPSIDIQDHQLVGALLILLELGEYELVLKIGRPYLSSGNLSLNSGLNSGRFGQPDIVLSDIVLTLAFACLELGREQWQQGQYENAAESLETGRELLLREGLFASVRGEMQADLYKLRPYRVLELLALPEENEADRRQGMNLLRDMLQDRGGIDGTGDDESGLNVDDFLRFIQQLRSYLTSPEQQALFEAEARRPSAVATYLAVYALLARGFAYQQPALIRRAKLMLIRLGARQDVHLEQAVCALLLGQTEEASRALEQSHEYESIAFIREHSQGAPDLLPGLCLYAERWLQNEVFPHFRDLANQQASLKEYFANEQVQAYLEELPNESEAAQWTTPLSAGVVNGRVSHQQEMGDPRQTRSYSSSKPRETATATLEPTLAHAMAEGAAMPTAERISQLSPEGRLSGKPGKPGKPNRTSERQSRFPLPRSASFLGRRLGRGSLKLDQVMFIVAIAVLGVGTLIILSSRLNRATAEASNRVSPMQSQIGSSLVAIAQPLLAPPPDAPLTNETAQQVIETWLTAKAKAMGKDYELEPLADILVDPIRSSWEQQATQAKNSNLYIEYEHQVKLISVAANPTNPDETQVEAEVVETANPHINGQLDAASARSETLRVRYDLLRQDGKWRIRDITVL